MTSTTNPVFTSVTVQVELHFMCYAVYLKEWLAVFPRKHFLFMRTEDYKKDVRSHVLQVFQFLDLCELSAC